MLKSKHVGLRKAGNQTAHKEEKMPKKLSDNEATDSKSGKYIQRNNCIQSGAISPLLRTDVEFGKGSSEERGGRGRGSNTRVVQFHDIED